MEPKIKDGNYDYNELKNALNDDFKNEKELCDYIEQHINLFTRDCLGFELLSYKREFQLVKSTRSRGKGNRRIDFFIKTKCGKSIGIEAKKPTYDAELSSAIGQCLTYITLFEVQGILLEKIVIVSSKIDFVTPITIKRFNLPIDFMVMDKSKHLKYLKDGRP